MDSHEDEEIERLRGEVAAARRCIATLYGYILMRTDDDARDFLLGTIGSGVDPLASVPFSEGFADFNNHLTVFLDMITGALSHNYPLD